MVVVGGSFTQVRQTATSPTTLTRNRVFAFNADHGCDQHDFNPEPEQHRLQGAAGTGRPRRSTSAAGSTRRTASRCRSRLFKANVATGAAVTGFKPGRTSTGTSATSRSSAAACGSPASSPTSAAAQRRSGPINATTGALRHLLHRRRSPACTAPNYPGDVTNVLQISTTRRTPSSSRSATSPASTGCPRSQIALFDIAGGASHALAVVHQPLHPGVPSKFETYVTDVEYSPDGSFFAVSTAGAFGGSTGSNAGTSGCDVVARFETGAHQRTDVRPPGRPTPAVTPPGPSRSPTTSSTPVATSGSRTTRAGNAAGRVPSPAPASPRSTPSTGSLLLEPHAHPRRRGPGHARHAQGLYVGSDTDRIGAYEYHARIALLPLAGGTSLPPMVNRPCPATVYPVAPGVTAESSQLRRHARASAPAGYQTAPRLGSSVGAFMVNGALFTATSNGPLTKRTFDGRPTARRPRSTPPMPRWPRPLAQHRHALDHEPLLRRRPDLLHPIGTDVALPSRLRARERHRGPAAVHQPQRHGHQLRHDARRLRRRTATSTSPTPPAGCSAPSGPAPRRWAAPPSQISARARTPRRGTPASCSSSRAAAADQPAADRVADVHCTDLTCSYDSTGSSRPRWQHRLGPVAVR